MMCLKEKFNGEIFHLKRIGIEKFMWTFIDKI